MATVIELGRDLAARGLPAFSGEPAAQQRTTVADGGYIVSIRRTPDDTIAVGGVRFQTCGGGRRVIRHKRRIG